MFVCVCVGGGGGTLSPFPHLLTPLLTVIQILMNVLSIIQFKTVIRYASTSSVDSNALVKKDMH